MFGLRVLEELSEAELFHLLIVAGGFVVRNGGPGTRDRSEVDVS